MAARTAVAGGEEFMPATAKGEATRRYLLSIAAEMFAERGYTATTLSELIAASGLTKGAFYFYFRSKAELALAVLNDQQGRWLERVHRQVLSLPSAIEQLQALVPALLELIEDEPQAWSLSRLTKELAADPALSEKVSKPMTEWVRLVGDIVRRGQQDGSLRSGLDAAAVGVVLVGAFDGLKALTDVLDRPVEPVQSRALFRLRAQTLQTLFELALAPIKAIEEQPTRESPHDDHLTTP